MRNSENVGTTGETALANDSGQAGSSSTPVTIPRNGGETHIYTTDQEGTRGRTHLSLEGFQADEVSADTVVVVRHTERNKI